MEFTLHYRGLLKPNGGPDEKHALRRVFHSQLRQLWQQKPLSAFWKTLVDRTVPDQSLNVVRDIHGFTFVPLVCEKTSLVAELSITLLRPEPPGAIVTQAGDIDNRLKTLLDALKVPSEPTALPPGTAPAEGENPFFCLLEDDNLITALAVKSDRLLEPDLDARQAEVLINVRVRALQVFFGTVGLGS
jgi:hypothetical protein